MGFNKIHVEYLKSPLVSRNMTILDVSRHLKVSWDMVKDIQKRFLKRRFAKPKLKKMRVIAIDEIIIDKGHQYLTVVLNPPFRKIILENVIAAQLMGVYDFITKSVAHKN
jgi:hypothetical protein